MAMKEIYSETISLFILLHYTLDVEPTWEAISQDIIFSAVVAFLVTTSVHKHPLIICAWQRAGMVQ